MNVEGTLKAIAGCGLPRRLKAYLGNFVRRETDSSLRRALKAAPGKVLKNMEGLLASSAAVLGIPEEEALSVTGFEYTNFAGDRLEAALAELRAVSLLDREGFSNIRVIPTGPSRTADIAACLGVERFAFEVRCVGGLPAKGAEEFFKAIYLKKIRQARISVKKRNAVKAGVFIVMDPVGAGQKIKKEEIDESAGKLRDALTLPPGEHVCLAAGSLAAFCPPFR